MKRTNRDLVSAPVELMELMHGGRVSQAINVAATLGVADQLAEGPRRLEEIAEAVGAQPRALRRLLRLLAFYGVFAELDDSRFSLTRLGELLRSDEHGSLRHYAMFQESPYIREAWTHLIEAVRTSEAAFDQVHGQQLFDYLADHPNDATMFDQAMAGVSQQLTAAIGDVYDFDRFQTVVDVGGGTGALLAEILTRSPATLGILYELPDVAQRARALLRTSEVADRCEVVEGDFFESVPAGYDAYLLTRVIHDWDDAAVVRILTSCRAAMAGNARLLLGEIVLSGDGEPSLARLADLQMLVIGGQERTEPEYRELLERAGLRLLRVVPSAGPLSLIEAAVANDAA